MIVKKEDQSRELSRTMHESVVKMLELTLTMNETTVKAYEPLLLSMMKLAEVEQANQEYLRDSGEKLISEFARNATNASIRIKAKEVGLKIRSVEELKNIKTEELNYEQKKILCITQTFMEELKENLINSEKEADLRAKTIQKKAKALKQLYQKHVNYRKDHKVFW